MLEKCFLYLTSESLDVVVFRLHWSVLGAIKYYNVCTERLLCRKGCDILHSYMSALSLLILWWREGAGGFVDTLTMFYWVDRLYCFLNIAVNNHLTTQTIQTFLWQNVMKIFMRLQ